MRWLAQLPQGRRDSIWRLKPRRRSASDLVPRGRSSVLLQKFAGILRLNASFKDGVLTITVPVEKKPGPHRIPISIQAEPKGIPAEAQSEPVRSPDEGGMPEQGTRLSWGWLSRHRTTARLVHAAHPSQPLQLASEAPLLEAARNLDQPASALFRDTKPVTSRDTPRYHRLSKVLGWLTPAERYNGTPFTDRGFQNVPALAHLPLWLTEVMNAA